MSLTDLNLERYSRNILLPEIGGTGQEKLLNSKVLVVGAGGLGSPVIMYLAALGIGNITIVDHDKIELSNLQRQIIHNTEKIGVFKSDSAANFVNKLNPDINVNSITEKLSIKNADKLINHNDIVVDGSDNFETRYLINDAAHLNGKIVVSGALLRFEGQLTTFRSGLKSKRDEPCYRCLFPAAPPTTSSNRCEDVGILGSVAGVIGTLQATEVLKEIIGLGETMSGKLLIFDAMNMQFRKIRYKRRLDCVVCGDASSIKDIT